MVDYAPPSSYQFRSMKPKPAMSINSHLTPQNPYGPPSASSTYSNTRLRPLSLGQFPPSAGYNAYYGVQTTHPQQQYYPEVMRTSSTSTGRSNDGSMQLGRSASTNTSSSVGSPASNYVAALRRQKATVWCEKSQPEDPRLLAAQRAAKLKATQEVFGPSSSGSKGGNHGLRSTSSSTTSLRGVGRNHKLGKSSTVGIGTSSLVNQLPPRLSATEANDDSSDGEELYMSGTHRRSGSHSGRSSLNSNHRTYIGGQRTSSISGASGGMQRTTSRGSSGSNYSPDMSTTELADPRGKSRVPVSGHILEETSPDVRIANSYFEAVPKKPAVEVQRSGSTLRRMGSVDEREVARTMTMSGLRLVVANPD
ncbi:hypothetical protein FN846DRAFT_773240 [Sphaerosporella brunnea]|uniref:Uncharacterized protein n=1 Tax=Sphaerosporella brunnea TaxID=1250544 RepID=A0A5J5F6F6_9PEZI|nr:hypothetical protein FN846DRAFT_773240 [Sphaerosporella brunnea]